MYAKNKGRAVKGEVTVEVNENRLRLGFHDPILGKRKTISLGLADSKQNMAIARSKAAMLEEDLRNERYDGNVKKYKHYGMLSLVTGLPSLKELWAVYIEHQARHCSPNTMRNIYKPFSSYIDRDCQRMTYKQHNSSESIVRRPYPLILLRGL